MEPIPDFFQWLHEVVVVLPWWQKYPAIALSVFCFGPAAGIVFSLGAGLGGLNILPTFCAYVGGSFVRDAGFCWLLDQGVNKKRSWLRSWWWSRNCLAAGLRRARSSSWRSASISYETLFVCSRFIKPPYVPLGIIALGVIARKSVVGMIAVIAITQTMFSAMVIAATFHPYTQIALVWSLHWVFTLF